MSRVADRFAVSSPSVGLPNAGADTLISAAVILPNDVGKIETAVEELLAVLRVEFTYYELLLIDNGLSSECHALVQRVQTQVPNVRLIRLSRRYSVEVALAAALDHSIGDYVVLIEPSIHPPGLLRELVDRAKQGSDSVAAVPVVKREGFFDRMIVERLARLTSKVLGVRVQLSDSYYTVLSRRLVNSIIRIRSKNRYLSYINASIGLSHSVISYEAQQPEPRQGALRRLLHLLGASTNMMVSNSAIPLRFASALGLLASAANLFYLGYILVVTLVKAKIAEGWLTTSLTQASMFLVLFLIITILSEYIARILDETKEQPLYFVECESYSTVSDLNRDRLNVIHDAGDESGYSKPESSKP